MTSLPFEDLPAEADEFDDLFWPGWPLKIGKKDARKALRKALDRADIGRILDGRDSYIRHKPPWQNWMHAATYLNGDHWEDCYMAESQKPDPDLAWQHKAAMAKTSWGRHNVPRQDIEECHRRGLLTDDELAEALR